MTVWILAVLALFFVQTMLAPICQYALHSGVHLGAALGPRDNPPPMPPYGARFQRALANMMEALPIFLALALLAEIRGVTDGLAVTGAMAFFIARVLYVPSYIWGFSGLRSLMWFAGHGSLIVMLIGLWPHLTA